MVSNENFPYDMNQKVVYITSASLITDVRPGE